jgi:hypothetical protein
VGKTGGTILRELAAVEAEVLQYFESLFQGRDTATAKDPEPQRTSTPFQPSAPKAEVAFLSDLPSFKHTAKIEIHLGRTQNGGR